MQLHATAPSHGFAANLGQIISHAARGALTFLLDLSETPARMREIERLSAKSDAQLAQLGLRRDEIVHHVFRDRLS